MMRKLMTTGAVAGCVVVAACSGATQTPASPSAAAGGSATAAADGSTLKVTAPTPLAPTDGARTDTRKPTLQYSNATGRFAAASGLSYEIEVQSAAAVVYTVTQAETPTTGAHTLPNDLNYDTEYVWRVRARIDSNVGPWSQFATFRTVAQPVVVPPPSGGGDGCAAPFAPDIPGSSRVRFPNDIGTVLSIASSFPNAFRNSCQPEGGSWEFMDRTVDALRAKDGRYANNAKRGNMNDPSLDVISYYNGPAANTNPQGSTQVYIVDLIGGHCGSSPSVVWSDVTDVTFNSGTVGRYLYPRPGRTVPTCTTTTGGGAQ